ncbi:class I SAM-dependent methyltransferase [Methanoculleus sp. FWC-SCC3]|uniref:Class I SAM-dependent methyltransferase n=1 Tax=Methanoculleus methanifontis TaxID=2584086 RepID=A0ABT8M1X9_9EURY|nr:class I SAM-dependent methyltransferase [Methanoculleus sp. FWC-SCC3]MDN7012107.1 class I SAM-dependent methyltransferase [Methanoculleus sp. FWC-SCC3]
MAAYTHNTAEQADRMPDLHFRLMSLAFRVRDRIRPPGRLLVEIRIREGMTVVDYGCGPGSYVKEASGLVGAAGTVYAVDVHELAVEAVSRRARKEGLANVVPVRAKGYDSGLPDAVADLAYALDMFHMVENQKAFLAELHRITKPDGILILDDGHQPREKTRRALLDSGLWTIEAETGEYLRCRPLSGNTPTE